MEKKILAAVGLVVLVITLLALTPAITNLTQNVIAGGGMTNQRSVWVSWEGDSRDGEINNDGTTYLTVRNAATGTISIIPETITIGQDFDDPTYIVYRGFLMFDLELLPDFLAEKLNIPAESIYIENIAEAYVELVLVTNNNETDFNIVLQNNATFSHPEDTLAVTDYSYIHYGSNHGQYNTNNLPTFGNQFNITVNANGRAFILASYNANELVKWAARSDEDITPSAPTGSEYILVGSQEWSLEYPGEDPPWLHMRILYTSDYMDWTFTGASGAQALLGLVPFIWIASILGVAVYGAMVLMKND